MPEFDLSVPADPSWTALTRDLVATAAIPLDLTTDRFNDLLVLTTQVVSAGLTSSGVEEVRLVVTVDPGQIEVRVETGTGPAEPLGQVVELALEVLADRHEVATDRHLVGFVFAA